MSLPNRKISTITLHNSTRFAILAVSTICLSLIVSNSLALNFTIICMTHENENDTNGNLTNSSYDYSSLQQGWLFSIIAVGQFFGTVALNFCQSKLDTRKTFTSFGLASGIATLFTPLSASIGFVPLLFMRFLQGTASSMSFAGIGTITQQWSTLKDSGVFLALLSCHFQIGNVFTMPVAGLLCESRWGWPALYYLQGGMTTIAFLVFYLFYRDDPYWHGFVSNKELSRIEHGKISVFSRETKSTTQPKVPYKAILTDKVVWGVQIGIAGVQTGFVLFVQYGPVYMNKVLKFDIKSTGVGTALPYVASIFMKILGGPISDYARCVSMKNNVRILTVISNTLLALGTLSLAFITMDYPILAQIAFITSLAFSGLNAVGSMKGAQLMSQHYSYVLMNMVTVIASFVVLILPLVIAVLAPDNTHSQWRVIFIGVSIITFTCMVVCVIMVEVEPRPWVKNSAQKSQVYTADITKTDIISQEKYDGKIEQIETPQEIDDKKFEKIDI